MGRRLSKLTAIEVSLNHLTEKEYQSLDRVMSSTKDVTYCFVASIYDEGVIIFNGLDRNIASFLRDNTKRDYPNLFGILEFCLKENIQYIDFFDMGNKIDEFQYHKWDN